MPEFLLLPLLYWLFTVVTCSGYQTRKINVSTGLPGLASSVCSLKTLATEVGQGIKRREPELCLSTVQSLLAQTQIKSVSPAGCNTICTVCWSVVLADLWVGAMGCWLPV